MNSKLKVICAGCKTPRSVWPSDWEKRKSDYCGPCMRRVRVGLKPSAAPSEKGTRLHNIWCGMRQRCGHKKGGHDHDVKHYADRGIEVCPEWRVEFEPFKLWALSNGFEPHLILDRKDNNIGYTPENCRFVTILESNRNKRSTLSMGKVVDIRNALKAGVKRSALASQYNVTCGTIDNIVNNKTWR